MLWVSCDFFLEISLILVERKCVHLLCFCKRLPTNSNSIHETGRRKHGRSSIFGWRQGISVMYYVHVCVHVCWHGDVAKLKWSTQFRKSLLTNFKNILVFRFIYIYSIHKCAHIYSFMYMHVYIYISYMYIYECV